MSGSPGSDPSDPRPDAASAIEQAYSDYLSAVLAGERRAAFRAVERALGAGLDLRTQYLHVFQPTLREVGRLWEENRLSVAEEHVATAITHSAMLRLYGALEMPDGTGPTLIAACAETERHEIGLRMLCDFLDLDGWDTVFLGATVPTEDLVAMVRERRPQVVALSATIAPHLPQVRRTIAALHEASGDAPPLILVGGRPFLEDPALVATVGADLCAADAAEAARLLRDRFP
jgi:MerR family transcriptional regulator, light-induced transcriptional regulator